MVFWKKKSFTSSLFWLKMKKKNVFEDTWFVSRMIYQIKMQAATNWSSHLQNHLTFDFFFSNNRFFTQCLKITLFRDF